MSLNYRSLLMTSSNYPDWMINNLSSVQFMNALSSDINTFNDVASTFGSLGGTNKCAGGVLAPNGKIYCIPSYDTSVLVIDPTTNTSSTFGSFSTSGWSGGVLAPNGKIYGIPNNNTSILVIGDTNIPQDMNKVLSRYLNKF